LPLDPAGLLVKTKAETRKEEEARQPKVNICPSKILASYSVSAAFINLFVD
jgi:hypothetical protein